MAKQLTPIFYANNDTPITLITLANNIVAMLATEVVTANTSADGALTIGNTYLSGIMGASVVAAGSLRGGAVNASANLILTTNLVTTNSSLVIAVGNTTINSIMVNSAALVSNLVTIGNSSVNISITTTSVTIGNSSVNATINSTFFTGTSLAALTSNNALNLGGAAANTYIANTGDYTLAGNISFTGFVSTVDVSASDAISVGNTTTNSTINSTAMSIAGAPVAVIGDCIAFAIALS